MDHVLVITKYYVSQRLAYGLDGREDGVRVMVGAKIFLHPTEYREDFPIV
jgi:hypothetical protein